MRACNLTEDQLTVFGAVCVELTHAVDRLEQSFGYQYHPFDGFPGFWHFCGRAAAVFAMVEEESSPIVDDSFIDIINTYAKSIIDRIEADKIIPCDDLLTDIARAAFPSTVSA